MGPSYTSENQNFFRLVKLFKDEATQVLRYVVKKEALQKYAKVEFSKVLDEQVVKDSLQNVKKKRVISEDQWLLLYPNAGKCDLDALDFTLLFILMRNVIGMSEPAVTGWNAEPNPTDMSAEACLVRLKLYRNRTLDHRANALVNAVEFKTLFDGIKSNILELVNVKDPTGTLKISEPGLEAIRTNTTDPGAAAQLKSVAEEWYQREVDINETMERIERKVDNLNSALIRTRSTSCGEVSAERETSVAALGRDLQLGIPYDIRKEECFKSTALWSTKHIKLNKVVKKDNNTWIFKILEDCSLRTKTAALEMDTRLLVSWLSGLVEAKGSSKVITHQVPSMKRSNVILQRQRIVHSETLNTTDIGLEGKEDQLGMGTHVITAITFGENVFFVFECENKKLSEMKKIVQDLITRPITNDRIKVLSKEWETLNNPTCQVYDDANSMYTLQSLDDIAKKLRNPKKSNKAKPLWAQLCPLGNLGSNTDAGRCMSHVGEKTARKIEDTVGKLIDYEKLLYDMKLDLNHLGFQDTIGLQQFQAFIPRYKSELKSKLKKDVEGIRKGDINQDNYDWNYLDGPTSCKFVIWDSWVRKKSKMICTLKEQLRNIQEVNKIQVADLKNTLKRKKHKDKYLVCFKVAMVSRQSDVLLERILSSTIRSSVKRKSTEEHDGPPLKRGSTKKRRRTPRKSSSTKKTHGPPTKRSSNEQDCGPKCKRGKREVELVGEGIELTKDEEKQFVEKIEIFTSFLNANIDRTDKIAFLICQDDCQIGSFEAQIHLYKNGVSMDRHFLPPTQPGKVTCCNKSPTSLTIQWRDPESGQKLLEKYEIRYRKDQNEEFTTVFADRKQYKSKDRKQTWQLSKLEVNANYRIQVRAVCGDDIGFSVYSELSEKIKTGQDSLDKTKCRDNLTQINKHLCEELNGMKRYRIGPDDEKRRLRSDKMKTILMVGESGSGKTTMINAIVNYLKGVQWDTNKRYILTDTEPSTNKAFGQTKNISAYTISKEEIESNIDYDLTIVDSPGYGDPEGIPRDIEITAQMREFFRSEGLGAVKQFDAVVFIVPEANQRLTVTQNYIFKTILALFGASIKDNTFIFFTFSSVNEKNSPPALDAIQEAQVQYKAFFSVNNGGLYAESASTSSNSSSGLWQQHWTKNQAALDCFFQSLNNTTSRSVELTNNVLDQRHQMMNCIENICAQLQTDTGLNKLDQLHEELEVIRKRKKDINKNKSFTYQINTTKTRVRPNRVGFKSTVCLVCNWNCHQDCQCIIQKDKKEICEVVNNKKGECTRCPKKCKWSCHSKNPYKLTTEVITETREISTLQTRYEQKAGKQLSAQDLEKYVKEDIEETQRTVTNLIKKARDCVNELSGSEQQNTITTISYIELLIAAERESNKQGWRKRVSNYEEILEQYKKMKEFVHDGKDPRENYKKVPAPYTYCIIL